MFIPSHFNYSQINSLKKFFYISLLTSSLLSCDAASPDPETLHFTTYHGVKASLDFDLEVYRADENPNLFYINFKYYRKNKNGQWAYAKTPTGPWKVFPEQEQAPLTLRQLKN